MGTPTPAPTPQATPAPAPEPTPEPTPAFIEYVVQEGDTWFGIAELFGVDAQQLAAFNGLTLEDVLHPGDVLAVPQ
jgi:LysM repeat protein